MRSVKPVLGGLVALALLALIVRQVSQAVRHTFTTPVGVAQTDRGSPRAQNGLTLLEVDNVSPDRNYSYTEKGGQTDNGGSSSYTADDTGLWIKMPSNYSLPPNCSASQETAVCGGGPAITGRASTGETFPLAWRTSSDSGPSGSPIYLLAPIPAGYSDTFRWVDVTLDDKRGDTATWRITHLPPMQHVLAPPIQAQTAFHQGNVQITARAYGGPDSNNPNPTPGLRYDMKGTIKGAAHQWELGHLTETLEWEPPNSVPQEAGLTMGMNKAGSTVNFETEEEQLFYNRSLPYLADIHWVRLTGKLQEFETYDETVTFHNVSLFKPKNGGSRYLVGAGAETVTTPSGITVTLDDVQHKANFVSSWGGDGYALHLLFPQAMVLPSLPQSPLWRKYKRLVRVSADIPKPYYSSSSSSNGTEETCQFRTSEYGSSASRAVPLPKVIANFPVIVRQRVDLSSVPVTFTLPVGNKPPKTPL